MTTPSQQVVAARRASDDSVHRGRATNAREPLIKSQTLDPDCHAAVPELAVHLEDDAS